MIPTTRTITMAALIFAFAIFCYGADTVASANTATQFDGRPMPGASVAPNGTDWCDVRPNNPGQYGIIAYHYKDNDGVWREKKLVHEQDVNGFILPNITCLNNGAAFVTEDWYDSGYSYWRVDTAGQPNLILSPGKVVKTDKDSFYYDGYALTVPKLRPNGNLVFGLETLTSDILVEAQSGQSGFLLLSNFGNRYLFDACVTANAAYTVTTLDFMSGTYERIGANGQQLEQLAYLGYLRDGTYADDPYTLGCGGGKAALVFQQSGGVSMNVADETSSVHTVLGNRLDNNPVSDLRQGNIGTDGNVYFVMTVASPDNFAEGGVVMVNNGTAKLVATPPHHQDIGLLNFATGIQWFPFGKGVSKPQ